MKSKNIRPTLSRAEHEEYVRNLLSGRESIFGKSMAAYALDTADLTEKIFRSRYRPGYEILHREIREKGQVIWHLALLSIAQLYGGITFEEIMDISHIEIAGAINLVNPDYRCPMDQRVQRYACGLKNASDLVKITAFSRVLASIKYLTENVSKKNLPHDQLYELGWLLKEFRLFSGWSKYAQETWLECADIVNSWCLQGAIKRNIPKPSLHFSLDASIRISNLREVLED